MFFDSNLVGEIRKHNVVSKLHQPEISLCHCKSTSAAKTTIDSSGYSLAQRAFPSPYMTTKMKGLLKGLRYISQIFEQENCKEKELEIGFPTDVKHVAHIGFDGPSVNSSPSWMTDFKPEVSCVPSSNAGEDTKNQNGAGSQDSSTTHDIPELPKPSKRHSSTGGHSSMRESSDGTKSTRRQHNSSTGADLSSRDPNAVPRARKKKSKGTSGSGSTRSSRSKSQSVPSDTVTLQDLDPGSESKNGGDLTPKSGTKVLEDEEVKKCESYSGFI